MKNMIPISTINNPERSEWPTLCLRPQIDQSKLEHIIREIFDGVKQNGDQALLDYTAQFDGVALETLVCDPATSIVDQKLVAAIDTAISNIRVFHESQKEDITQVETTEGVFCWRKSVGIERVGLYVPGGTAPLFSTLLMLAIPAQIAGCKEIIVCSPPDQSGEIAPIIQYVAHKLGIKQLYKLGGAQAIAAMAIGTESIPKVDKIFGPGNQFVTKAKQQAQTLGVSIDMPAGPSEVLVIADEHCVPEFVAADLLSQAEHGGDSQVILLSTSQEIMTRIIGCVQEQITELPRRTIAMEAITKSRFILFDNLTDAIDFSNHYAPEHLILAVANAETIGDAIINAGSVFLGNYSCESAGDYASGTNHTLPTNGFAKAYSGVSLDSFVKKITFQKITQKGIQNLGPAIEQLATAEQLYAHKNAVTIRLKSLQS